MISVFIFVNSEIDFLINSAFFLIIWLNSSISSRLGVCCWFWYACRNPEYTHPVIMPNAVSGIDSTYGRKFSAICLYDSDSAT